ncbi:MAG: hypothetical protein IAF38_20090 [Bacteroidia bacterium]|nr:hypothetical protein [Bacteroidia bacterium]
MDAKRIVLSFCEMYLEEPGIIMTVFSKDTDVDESAAVELLGNLLKLAQGEPHGLIYDFNKKNIIIREITRKISSVRDERTSKLICRAFIASSLQNKLESKHFIQAGKPQAETNYFSTKEEALDWVRSKMENFRKN